MLFALDSHAQTSQPTGYGGISHFNLYHRDNTDFGSVRFTQPEFGGSVANLGDIDNDGIDDLAVGSGGFSPESNQLFRGAVYIFLMNSDETIKSYVRITEGTTIQADGTSFRLNNGNRFGISVANIGDFDGDRINELAVGSNQGRIYLLRLNSSGQLHSFSTINTNDINNMLDVNSVLGNTFGISIANLGDIDGDGVIDLAVGAHRGDGDRGSVHILFMEKTGTGENIRPGLKSVVKLDTTNSELNNGDAFGVSVANIGDLNGDRINDLAVGAIGDDEAANNAGTVYIFHLDRDGSLKPDGFEIDDAFNAGDAAGRSIANLGDLNGDGINDIAVGAVSADSPPTDDTGAVFTIFMGRTRAEITTNDFFRIDTNSLGLNLSDGDRFSEAIANIGDRNGDGIDDLAVGANRYDTTGTPENDNGAFYIMYMDAETVVTNVTSTVANGRYRKIDNDIIEIQVIFSAVVTVSGEPILGLENRFGDSDTDAVYDRGSGSNTLTFVYTVIGGDFIRDLDYKNTASLILNGGTINTSTAPNYRALLTLPEPGTRGSLSSNKNISIHQQAITNTRANASTNNSNPGINSSHPIYIHNTSKNIH